MDLLYPKRVCFCGYPPLVDCRILDCFAMKLTITPLNAPTIVRLSDFARMEKGSKRLDNWDLRTVDVAKIPGEVFFTAEDAFLFFSNLNVSKTGFSYFASDFYPFNIPSIRDRIKNRYAKFLHLVNLASHPVVSAYISSLIHQLQDDSLSLPKLHKLLYFTLLTLCHYKFEEKLPLVADFFATNEPLLEQLKKDIRSSVPKLTWETKYWDDVKAFYLK
ncbi:MAG: hypothetical protein ACTSSB_10260 [Candidatus Heimdallarchaeota archaeon]